MVKNEAQERIIQTIDGQMIVVACPGSGKTTTLLRRIHHMIETGIPANEILMITFTKAAAREMGQRYSKMYGKNPGVTFCTVHALCLALLNHFARYTPNDIVKNQDDYVYPTIQKNRNIQDKASFVSDALLDISNIKSNGLNPATYEAKCTNDHVLFERVYHNYVQGLKDDGLIDYDDMLLYAKKLMEEEPDVLSWIRDKYAYIHVDEYQDTNFVQRDIVYLLAGDNGNLVVVGDDDQSIYAFRGAKPEVMLGFQEKYPDAVRVDMVTNYRSDREIIRTASSLIQHNEERFDKKFLGHQIAQGKVDFCMCPGHNAEMKIVAAAIQQLIAKGTDPNNIAVLYRTNAQSAQIATALNEAGVEFYSNESLANPYTGWMFQDIDSYFKIARGSLDQREFLRTVEHPMRWISKINLQETGLDADKMAKKVRDPNKAEWKNKKSIETVYDYVTMMRIVASKPVPEALRTIYTIGDYAKHLQNYAEFRNQDLEQMQEEFRNFLSDAERWKVRNYEEWQSKIRAHNQVFLDAQKKTSGVCLSTMHKSKGLEWDHVFLIDCVNGTNPLSVQGEVSDMEEERRLFYVAMTRARHDLQLYAYSNGTGKKKTPSNFLGEAGVL